MLSITFLGGIEICGAVKKLKAHSYNLRIGPSKEIKANLGVKTRIL